MNDIRPHGLHHVTAIASDPQRNVDFYTHVLGLRMVKQTVNFDAPDTYHLYYGDQQGHPSTLLTFFPWRGVPKGKQGTGLTTATASRTAGATFAAKTWTWRIGSSAGPNTKLSMPCSTANIVSSSVHCSTVPCRNPSVPRSRIEPNML